MPKTELIYLVDLDVRIRFAVSAPSCRMAEEEARMMLESMVSEEPDARLVGGVSARIEEVS